MKVSIDHVTNSSSESFGTVIVDSVAAIGLAVPFIAATMGAGEGGEDEEGDEYTYAPYESTDPEDPPGTIIQKNKNGTITKTLPDGTTGTKMPDGTVYVSSPDGSTAVIDPDGHQTVNMPDGTKIEHYTNGTAHAEYPDGSVRTEYTDGTIRTVDAEGEMVQVNPDGSFEVREPGKSITKVYDPEGRIVGATDDHGSNIKIDGDANISGTLVTADGESFEVSGNRDTGMVVKNDSGTRIEIDSDGKLKNAIVKNENGYLQINEDGSIKSEGIDPKTGFTFEFDFSPENGLKYKNSNGDFVDVDAQGKGEARIVNEDGELTIDRNGRVEAKDKDGNYERYEPNADGTGTWERGNADGTQIKGEIDADGNATYTSSDGSKLEVKQDSVTVVDSTGKSTTYTKDQLQQMAAEQKMAVDHASNLEGGE